MSATTANPTANEATLAGPPACPTCGGKMWDNRAMKRNPKAPDFKCRDRGCDGVVWPGHHTAAAPVQDTPPRPAAAATMAGERSGEGQGSSARSAAAAGPLADTVRTVVGGTLRTCYLDLTDFVLADVRPKYEAAGVPCTDATVAAIVATLFIATCKNPGTGGGA